MNNYANNVTGSVSTKKLTWGELTKSIFFITVFICFGWLIMNPKTVSELSKNGAVMAVLSVMPSTFPYLVLSGFIINGGIADLVGKALSPISKFYRLSKSTVCTIFIYLISGFPVPSAMAYSLYRQGKCTVDDCEAILGFCSFCGAPFIISLFGTKIMNDPRAGVVLFAVQSLMALIYGKILAATKNEVKIMDEPDEEKSTDSPLGVIICKSITEGGLSMLKIISFIVFFAIFSGFFKNLVLWIFPHTPPIIISLLKGFLEISSGISSLSELHISNKLKFILGGMYIYWSGLSVFFQVSSSTNGAFSMKKYLLGRIFMILAGLPTAYFIYFYLLQ